MNLIKYELVVIAAIMGLCFIWPSIWYIFVLVSYGYFLVVGYYDRWWHEKLEQDRRYWIDKYEELLNRS